jgi:SRSO17 transposase
VLIVDETADAKSSRDAVGAAGQYSGTVGGIALCQVAVTLTYATGRVHALIGRALYLPGACAADEEHRELAGVPEEVVFATRPQLAGGLLDRARSPWGSAPPSWPAMKCTAAASCAAASAGARWAM